MLPEFPEVFVSSTDMKVAVSKAVAAGRLRKLGSRLYTTNLKETPETLVRRQLWPIVAAYFPDAIVSDRTALDLRPASDGSVFLITASGADIDLPGIKLRPRRGEGLLPGDYPLRAGVSCSSQARAYLENMRPTRARSGIARTLKRDEIEAQLEALLRTAGEDGLNRLRDQVKQLAPRLGMEPEATELDRIIGALQGTRDAELTAPSAKARREGEPFDPARIAKFEMLHDELRRRALPPPRLSRPEGSARVNVAFFEAYFSNFIEGTEFEVDEAASIVFEGAIPKERPADAHDILGTFQIVSDANEMSRVPTSFDEFISLLKGRHRVVMHGRPGTRPGQFKENANRAGSTSFVHPNDVVGTLREGFSIYRQLDAPLDRATFMMFLVSEVHPFADGNGRVGRIMMNAELVAAGEARIVIPTIFRSNYISGLKALSQNDRPETLIRTLDFAQRYVASIDWSDFDTALRVLQRTNAFVRPEEGDDKGIRLRIATALDYDTDENDGGDGSGGGASGGPGFGF